MKPLITALHLGVSSCVVACGPPPSVQNAAPASEPATLVPSEAPAASAKPADQNADPAVEIHGFRLDLPCKGEKVEKGEACHWDQALAQSADPAWKLKRELTRKLGGTPGTLYDVTLRIRGVVEPKNFAEGSVQAEHFQTGGKATTDNYNFYNIVVSDPPATYTVNRHVDKVGHFVFAIDYQVTIPIRAGASVTLGAYDSNDVAIANHKSLSMPEIAATPFDGQFFQIDAISAVAK